MTFVLILGDSWIFWAKSYLDSLGIPQNLNIPNTDVKWEGSRGLRWCQFMPICTSLLEIRCPDVLILHVGGNDIGHVSSIELMDTMRQDLRILQDRYPNMQIIFSQIADRLIWARQPTNGRKLHRTKCTVNKIVSAFLSRNEGMSILHKNIRHDNPSIFRRDGVHLTNFGNSMFVENIRKAISNCQ